MRVCLKCVICLATASTLLSGCGSGTFVMQARPAADKKSVQVKGAVHGGQQPVSGAVVTLWAAGSSGYGTGASVLATATAPTDSGGNFSFSSISCPDPSTPTYLTAQGGNSGASVNNDIMLATGLGPCSGLDSLTANINEVTTVATAYALSHFFTSTLGSGSTDAFGGAATAAEGTNSGLVNANASTIPALVEMSSGRPRLSDATRTTEAAKLGTLANILATCVNSSGSTSASETTTPCGQLYSLTTPPGAATRPSDTLQAAVQMALYPYQNVQELNSLPAAAAPFAGLRAAPNDWTLAIGYKAAGMGLGINGTATSGTSSNLDIDASGRVWFPTNTDAAHGLAYFDPASSSFNGPFATSLAHPQYLAIDTDGIVWGTDMAGNQIVGVDSNDPDSTNVFQTEDGTQTGPIAVSSNATVLNALMYSVTGSGGSTIYQEHGGLQSAVNTVGLTPTGIAPYTYQSGARYFEAEVATSGEGSACQLEAPYNSKNSPYLEVPAVSKGPCISGGVAQFGQTTGESAITATSLNQICSYISQTCFAPAVPLSAPEGIAIDGDSNVWIANAGNGSVSTLFYSRVMSQVQDYNQTSPVAYLHGAAQGATMTTPYGIAIDRSGNVWISNAGCVTTGATACTPGDFILSELVGAAAPALTPLALQTVGVLNGTRPAAVGSRVGAVAQVARHAGGRQ